MIDLISAGLDQVAAFYIGILAMTHFAEKPATVFVPIEVERVPSHLSVLDAQVRSAAARAKMLGPGFVIQNATVLCIDGVRIGVAIYCDTSQIAPAPEKEARR